MMVNGCVPVPNHANCGVFECEEKFVKAEGLELIFFNIKHKKSALREFRDT